MGPLGKPPSGKLFGFDVILGVVGLNPFGDTPGTPADGGGRLFRHCAIVGPSVLSVWALGLYLSLYPSTGLCSAGIDSALGLLFPIGVPLPE